MTGVNKLFYAACAAWALGRKVDVRVMGDAREMKALSEALRTTNELREEITRDGATVESIVEKVERKREAIQEFQKVCGINWPV
jgi:hypothetical protein